MNFNNLKEYRNNKARGQLVSILKMKKAEKVSITSKRRKDYWK